MKHYILMIALLFSIEVNAEDTTTATEAATKTPNDLIAAFENREQRDYQSLWVGDKHFKVEWADTPETLARGLMYRKHLPDNHGMLFIFHRPKAVSFWMKNTLIPLDMLFFDAQGRLLEIKHNVPPCRTPECPTYPSKADNVAYVLEISGGSAKKNALAVGDRLKLPSG